MVFEEFQFSGERRGGLDFGLEDLNGIRRKFVFDGGVVVGGNVGGVGGVC